MPVIHLKALGRPTVLTPDGHRSDLPLGKPLAALCYVALESSRVRREDLGNVLWAGSSPERARASVRQAIWLLRKAVGEDILVEDESGLRLDEGRVSLDLDRFEECLARNEMVEAWKMWEGGPLHGFSTPDAPSWNAWADRLRGLWERRFGEALEVHAASEEGEARVTWFRRALKVRPYRESAHAALVETLVHQRRIEDAETALHEARTVVDEATPGLFADLEERLRVLRREPFEEKEGTLALEFVGRAAEFATLAGLWRSVLSGRSRTAAILGPTGIGKTRLADEVLELARVDGAVVAEVKGFETERGIELGVLAGLVRELLGQPGAAGISSGSLQVLRGLVPSAAGAPEHRVDRPDAAALGEALLDLVDAVAHESPLILRVEDLHWIDATSRSLILRTTRNLPGVRAMLLITCRTGESDGSARRVLDEMVERGRAARVELGPLTRGEIGEMLGLMFRFEDDETADRCAERLYRVSAGNPLFLLELLRGLRDQGLIETRSDQGGSETRIRRLPAELELPATVREALDRRLAYLSAEGRAAAAALAESDRPLRPAELQRRADLGEAEAVRTLGELLRRDVVRWTGDERVALSHDSLGARLRGAGRRGRGHRRSLARVLLGSAGVVVLIALGWVGLGQPTAAEQALEGVLFVETEGTRMVGLRLRETTGSTLTFDTVAVLTVEPGLRFSGPPTWVDGGWQAPVKGHRVLEKEPDAWIYRDGEVHEVLATPGDDVTRALLPDGRHLLLAVEDPDSSVFRMNTVRVDARTRDTTVLYADGAPRAVSPDGRFMILTLKRSRDSLVVIHPDGSRFDAVEVPHGRMRGGGVWCAPGEVIGMSERIGARTTLWTWTPGVNQPTEWELEWPALSVADCSPDGRYLALTVSVEDRERLVIIERATGEGHLIGPIGWGKPRTWVPDRPPEAPRGVELAREALTIPRGERDSVGFVVPGVSGELGADRLRWYSRDPLTASVPHPGLITANTPGVTWVVAEVDRWLRDSVRIEVVESDRLETAFVDPLETLDTARWQRLGFPVPEAVLFQGEPVVSMNGDGSRVDGMISKETFRIDRGVTFEVDFHIELTRPDQQSVKVCLVDAEPPGGSDSSGTYYGSWNRKGQLCFLWPADELENRDEGLARFGPRAAVMGPVSVEGVVQDSTWNRASIQIRPDGWTSLFVNGEYVDTYIDRIGLGSEPWRVAILGRAADTELYVRNVVVWSRLRYPVPEQVGPG